MPVKRGDKDPNKPKRATSAYFFYMAAERENAKKRGENISKVAEFTKAVSEKWRNLTDAQKKPFEAQAAKDKERYQKEMAGYVPPKGMATSKAAKRAAKDPNKPKRAQSAYFLFLADFRAKNKNKFQHDGGHKDLIKAAGQAWNDMSDEEKVPYQKKHEVEKAKYDTAMANYSAGGAAKKAKKAAPVESEEDEDDEEEEEEEDESD
jgi:hypothetical protein